MTTIFLTAYLCASFMLPYAYFMDRQEKTGIIVCSLSVLVATCFGVERPLTLLAEVTLANAVCLALMIGVWVFLAFSFPHIISGERYQPGKRHKVGLSVLDGIDPILKLCLACALAGIGLFILSGGGEF